MPIPIHRSNVNQYLQCKEQEFQTPLLGITKKACIFVFPHLDCYTTSGLWFLYHVYCFYIEDEHMQCCKIKLMKDSIWGILI